MSAAQDRRYEQAVSAWLASFDSAHTRAAYQRDMTVFRSWCDGQCVPVRQVTVDQVRRFGDDRLEQGESAATVQRRLAAVSSFYRHAGVVMAHVNPAASAPRPAAAPRTSVGLSAQEAADVWSEAVRQGPRMSVLIGLVLLDGMKSHELLRLDADSVPATLHPRTAAAVAAHLGGRRRGPLLMGENPTRGAERLTRYGVDYLVKSVGRGAGLAAPLTVNVLRNTHTALTWSPRRESNP